MTTRTKVVMALAGAALVAGGAAGLGHLSISRRVDRVVREAAASSDRLDVPIEAVTPRAASAADSGRTRLWTNVGGATDGAALAGGLIVASGGGLVELGTGTDEPRAVWTASSKRGLADHDVTAVTVRGAAAYLGTRSGLLGVVEHGVARSLRVDRGQRGAIVDLVWYEDDLYLATTSGAVVRVDGDLQTARLVRRQEVAGGVTALAVTPHGLAAAGADGAIYNVEDAGLVRLGAPSPAGEQLPRLTALAWHHDAFLAGTPTALISVDAEGHRQTLRANLFVTAVLPHSDRVFVGTFADGVLVLDGSRLASDPTRVLLPGRRIDRLRLVDGQPMAFGPRLVARLDATLGEQEVAQLPTSIASNHVTALAFDDQHRLWVGHFDHGVDVLAPGGEVERHLPGPELERMSSVNDLAFDGAAGVMLIATSHGVLSVSASGRQEVIDESTGLIGESVTALLLRAEERVFATSEGLSIAPQSGGEIRSIYTFHGLPSNRLYALAEQDGHLFVGTLGGVALLDGLRVRQRLRAAPEGLQANWCSALVATAEGIYVGTTGGGVDLRRPDGSVDRLRLRSQRRFTVNPGAMLVVGQRLLVGTLEHGLLVLDRDRQEWLDVEQPLPGAAVTALAVDDDFLYVGTNRGLLRLGRDSIGEPS